MLTVKLVRSLVLGETLQNPLETPPNLPTHHPISPHLDYDGDHDLEIPPIPNTKKKKKMPLLLFIPTGELIWDTFRLASIARDVGLDFNPSPSLSHLLFSWPKPTNNQHIHLNNNHIVNHRTSVSSATSNFTTTSASTVASSSTSSSLTMLHHYEAVPIPFPSLTTTSSVSLLRSFVSLSRGLFKLVFLDVDTNPNPNSGWVGYGLNYDLCSAKFGLVGRVTGKRVKCMDDLCRELAGHGWALFRSSDKRKLSSLSAVAGEESVVYLFRKKEGNRVRAKGYNGNCGGEGSRMRELRLNPLDWEKGVNLRVLLYILLMTGDIFYIS